MRRQVGSFEVGMLRGFFIAVILVMSSCGGGSEGTGARKLDGTVTLADSAPISGAVVTLVETGETTTTAGDGSFSLSDVSAPGSVTLQVEASGVVGTVLVDSVQAGPSNVSIGITVDTGAGTVHGQQVEVKALIVDFCDYYFENGTFIRQGNALADGTTCKAQISVYEKGTPVNGALAVVQHRRCEISAPWVTLTTATTGSVSGVAEVDFTFFNTPDYCQYRIVAPVNDARFIPVLFPIVTFQQQGLEFQLPTD